MAKKWPFLDQNLTGGWGVLLPPPIHDHKIYVEILNKNDRFFQKMKKMWLQMQNGGGAVKHPTPPVKFGPQIRSSTWIN